MACQNPKCNCTNCTNDICTCGRHRVFACKPEKANCCCKS